MQKNENYLSHFCIQRRKDLDILRFYLHCMQAGCSLLKYQSKVDGSQGPLPV